MRFINKDGFIMSYISALSEEDYTSSLSDRNQLSLEAKLRKSVSEKKAPVLSIGPVEPGMCIGNALWSPYYSHGSIFVDRSSFYSTLKRIRMYAATILISDAELDVPAILWTYMATGVYLNSSLIAETEHPVYKPIESRKCTLHLKEGRNEIVFVSENLGVRDTRNMLAFQLLSDLDHIEATIPGDSADYTASASFLAGIRIGKGRLDFPSPAPDGTVMIPAVDSPDHETVHRKERIPVDGRMGAEGADGVTGCRIELGNGMARSFEFQERIKPQHLDSRGDWEAHFCDAIGRIAAIDMLDRGEHGFAVFTLLARRYLGVEKGNEKDLFLNDLSVIKKRFDCSDFLMCGILRYIHEYGVPEGTEEALHDAITDYRYWMTMKGADGMCFWSENHSLMFWFSACDAGLLYPDELYHRTGMTGRELHEYGERRVDEWLDDVLEHGFEEFLSSTYMCVTFAVLLNVIDYCRPELSSKARKALDRIMEMLSWNTFRGTVIAPMGRVYRGVVYPFREATQALINTVDETAPYAYGEGWLAFLASSSYRFPSGLKALMDGCIEKEYSTGNAMVSVEKNESYLLTAVLSPRTDSGFVRWRNTVRDDGLDAEDNSFVKSLNECFHGTSCFQPGVYGYQQHMWEAALSAEAVVFANHPGTTSEDAELRPGYWNGNGVMPAISVRKGMIGSVYSIPENHPIGFTHLYVPFCRFSESLVDGHWIFLAKDRGYLAVWTSCIGEPYEDMMASSELRFSSRQMAYLVAAGRSSEQSFTSFQESVKRMDVSFSEKDLTLRVDGEPFVTFQRNDDWTQYLD